MSYTYVIVVDFFDYYVHSFIVYIQTVTSPKDKISDCSADELHGSCSFTSVVCFLWIGL